MDNCATNSFAKLGNKYQDEKGSLERSLVILPGLESASYQAEVWRSNQNHVPLPASPLQLPTFSQKKGSIGASCKLAR